MGIKNGIYSTPAIYYFTYNNRHSKTNCYAIFSFGNFFSIR